MYRQLATSIVLHSIRVVGIEISHETDFGREVRMLNPGEADKLAVVLSSAEVLRAELEPVVRKLISQTREPNPEVVEGALVDVGEQLRQGIRLRSASSLRDVRDQIAIILASSLPGDPTKGPRP